MSYSAHPKPWTWEEHELSTGFSCIVYDAAGQRVGTDHLYRADAAVIAAAPDLLKVLQRMLLDLERDGSYAAIATLNTDGRAAIAKATGAQP